MVVDLDWHMMLAVVQADLNCVQNNNLLAWHTLILYRLTTKIFQIMKVAPGVFLHHDTGKGHMTEAVECDVKSNSTNQ